MIVTLIKTEYITTLVLPEKIKGKYQIKNGVITFSPNKKEDTTDMLYIKDGFLCKDAACNEIFSKTDSTCKSLK